MKAVLARESLPSVARQLAVYARETKAYRADPVFRNATDEVYRLTQHIADEACDEIIAHLERAQGCCSRHCDRDYHCEHCERDKVKQDAKAQRDWRIWVYWVLPCVILVLAALFGSVVEVMAWWRVAFGPHL